MRLYASLPTLVPSSFSFPHHCLFSRCFVASLVSGTAPRDWCACVIISKYFCKIKKRASLLSRTFQIFYSLVRPLIQGVLISGRGTERYRLPVEFKRLRFILKQILVKHSDVEVCPGGFRVLTQCQLIRLQRGPL